MLFKKMKLLAIGLLFLIVSCGKQHPEHVLDIRLAEIEVPDVPAINSYAFARHNGLWLIVGGRIDGLHDHRPEYAYPADSSNRWIWLIDPVSRQVWSMDISGLSTGLSDQLQSTNMAFYQDGDRLILIGGYGWSREKNMHVTFPALITADVPALVQAVKSGGNPGTIFTRIENEKMAVSGGYLGKIGEEYYLVFGNRFDGKYSARPNVEHTQEYTNEIRKFLLSKQNDEMKITDYSAVRDTAHFHRRDFNMLPQIFPDGEFGYTAFSGVFQYERNFPWLYPVDITAKGVDAVEDFEQKFSHYHGACVSLYSESANQTANLFFGGMARFVPDPESGEIINDPLVPSVNTISQVTRLSDGTLVEDILEDKMPGLLGASANFIPAQEIPFTKSKLIDYDNLAAGENLIGYIYGGLESTHPNVFLQPKGVSLSTNRIFEVYVIKNE